MIWGQQKVQMDFSIIFDTLQLFMTPSPQVTKSGEKQNLALGLLV